MRNPEVKNLRGNLAQQSILSISSVNGKESACPFILSGQRGRFVLSSVGDDVVVVAVFSDAFTRFFPTGRASDYYIVAGGAIIPFTVTVSW